MLHLSKRGSNPLVEYVIFNLIVYIVASILKLRRTPTKLAETIQK